jgi:hypothetical protein
MSYTKIHINPISPEPTVGSVLVIYTGGTLGMVYETKGKQLVPFDFQQIIEKVPEISRLDFDITFLSLPEPIDSSNMNPAIWIELASIIGTYYEQYDSFVILHGTDTMAYTASALSYLLEKPQQARHPHGRAAAHRRGALGRARECDHCTGTRCCQERGRPSHYHRGLHLFQFQFAPR